MKLRELQSNYKVRFQQLGVNDQSITTNLFYKSKASAGMAQKVFAVSPCGTSWVSAIMQRLGRDRICCLRRRLKESLTAERNVFGNHEGRVSKPNESDLPGAVVAVSPQASISDRGASAAINRQTHARIHSDFDRLIKQYVVTFFERFVFVRFHRDFATSYRDARAAASDFRPQGGRLDHHHDFGAGAKLDARARPKMNYRVPARPRADGTPTQHGHARLSRDPVYENVVCHHERARSLWPQRKGHILQPGLAAIFRRSRSHRHKSQNERQARNN